MRTALAAIIAINVQFLGAVSTHANESALRESARLQAQALIRGASEHARLDPASRPGHALRLAAIAQARKATMVALAARDPHGFLATALPDRVHERLPAAARSVVESSIETEGVVRLLAGRDEARPIFMMWLETGAEQYALHLSGRSAGDAYTLALANRRIKIRGKRLDATIVADGASGITAFETAPTAATTTDLGDQTTLIAMINFSDAAVSCSALDAANRVFGATQSVHDLYRESTRGLVTFSGQAIGPFTIPYSASAGTCDLTGYTSAALGAIAAAGYNVADYRRVVFAMPPASACPAGLGNLGGTLPTRSWIFRCSATDVYAHELGHNLRLNHAASPSAEYGDYSDPMGAPGRLVQHHGANRAMAGWLPGTAIADLTASGTYALDPLELAASGMPQAARVRKADTSEYYYLSTRTPVGYDANLSSAYRNTLSVHVASGTMPSRTILVATLGAGQTFNDSVNGIAITYRENANGRITFALAFGSATCTRRPPTVNLAPISLDGSPGASLGYAVSVTNNDTPACGSSSFTLGQSLPGGFTGAFGAAAITVGAGVVGSTTWTVRSPTTAAEGTYWVQARATSQADATAAAAATGSYVVVTGVTPAPDTTAPSVGITSPAAGSTLRDKNVTVTATASDNVAVRQVEFYVDGTLIGSSSATPYSARWSTRRAARGAHTVTVRAVDTAGNAAAQSITVNLQ